jgi:hypothetical protein
MREGREKLFSPSKIWLEPFIGPWSARMEVFVIYFAPYPSWKWSLQMHSPPICVVWNYFLLKNRPQFVDWNLHSPLICKNGGFCELFLPLSFLEMELTIAFAPDLWFEICFYSKIAHSSWIHGWWRTISPYITPAPRLLNGLRCIHDSDLIFTVWRMRFGFQGWFVEVPCSVDVKGRGPMDTEVAYLWLQPNPNP